MLLIDVHAHTNRWRDRPAAEKAVLAGGMLLLSLVLPPFPAALLILAAMAGAAVWGARIPPGDYLRLLALPAGFLLTGAATLLVGVETSGGGLHPVFLPQGLDAAAALAARAGAALSCLLFLSLTTPATALVPPLRRLGVPPAVIEVMLLTYRFLFIAIDTARAMHDAQAARLGYRGWRRSVRSLGLLAAALLPRVLDRGRRLEAGLAARGHDGSLRVVTRHRPASPRFLALSFSAQALILLAGVLFR